MRFLNAFMLLMRFPQMSKILNQRFIQTKECRKHSLIQTKECRNSLIQTSAQTFKMIFVGMVVRVYNQSLVYNTR